MRIWFLFGVTVVLTLAGLLPVPAGRAVAQARCTTTLSPGQSLDDAVRRSMSGAVICLRSGIYGPLAVESGAPEGLTVQGTADGVQISGNRGRPAVSIEAGRFTLAGVTVRGGVPAAVRAAAATGLTLRDVLVEDASVGILLHATTTARLDGVTINAPIDAGLVVTGNSVVTAERLTVSGGGIGVAALNGSTRLTLRGGLIEQSAGPAVFAGVLGCADIASGTFTTPDCYYDDLDRYLSDVRLDLEDLTVNDGSGAGVVLYPGVRAEVRRTGVFGRGRGGLLAWGAEVTVTDSTIEANGEYGIAARAYPHAGVADLPPASARIVRTTIRSTRALSEGIGGHGVVGRGALLVVRDSTIVWNAAAGLRSTDASFGEVTGSDFIENGGAAMCLSADSAITESANRLRGNTPDTVLTCAGR